MQPYRDISPTSDSGAVYLVLDDFGSFGCAYRETDVSAADRQTIIASSRATNARSGSWPLIPVKARPAM